MAETEPIVVGNETPESCPELDGDFYEGLGKEDEIF